MELTWRGFCAILFAVSCVGAWALALVGPIGYLIFGGSQWWNWGQLTPFPLIMLAIARDPEEEGTFAGSGEVPWGPP